MVRVSLGLVQLVLSIFLAVAAVFGTYRLFGRLKKTRAGYDLEDELKKGNAAVATLLTAVMVAVSVLVQESVYPVIGTLTIYLEDPSGSTVGLWGSLAICAGHLLLGFLLAAGSMEVASWIFQRLASRIDHEGEIQRGNVAAAFVMAGVICVTTIYMRDGISSVTKALIPRPALGAMQILR